MCLTFLSYPFSLPSSPFFPLPLSSPLLSSSLLSSLLSFPLLSFLLLSSPLSSLLLLFPQQKACNNQDSPDRHDLQPKKYAFGAASDLLNVGQTYTFFRKDTGRHMEVLIVEQGPGGKEYFNIEIGGKAMAYLLRNSTSDDVVKYVSTTKGWPVWTTLK